MQKFSVATFTIALMLIKSAIAENSSHDQVVSGILNEPLSSVRERVVFNVADGYQLVNIAGGCKYEHKTQYSPHNHISCSGDNKGNFILVTRLSDGKSRAVEYRRDYDSKAILTGWYETISFSIVGSSGQFCEDTNWNSGRFNECSKYNVGIKRIAGWSDFAQYELFIN